MLADLSLSEKSERLRGLALCTGGISCLSTSGIGPIAITDESAAASLLCAVWLVLLFLLLPSALPNR